MATNEKEVKVQCVKNGMDGLFEMDRHIEPPTLTDEEKARAERKAAYEKQRKQNNE